MDFKKNRDRKFVLNDKKTENGLEYMFSNDGKKKIIMKELLIQ